MSEAIEVRSSSRSDEWGKWTTVFTTLHQADGYTIAVWSDSHSTVTVEVGIGRMGEEVSRGENDVPPRRFKDRRQGRAKTFQPRSPSFAPRKAAAITASTNTNCPRNRRPHAMSALPAARVNHRKPLGPALTLKLESA